MRVTPSSTSIAGQVKQSIIKKALAVIARRQVLFKNMNVYSLDQLSKIIQQINQQQIVKVKSTSITQTDDFTGFSFDNMMSMSQVKLMPHQIQNTQINISQNQQKSSKTSKKWLGKSTKKDKLLIIDLLEDETASRENLTTCYSINKQQKQQQSTQIQAFRLIKKRQHQQMLIKRQSQQKKKAAAPINLNNQRVMYGYDSKIIKLQKMREKQNHSISQMNSSLIYLEDSNKKKTIIEQFNNKTPISIKDKINITQKQAQQARELQTGRKTRRNYKTILQPPTVVNIRVNPQSHKEMQQAIAVKQPGIRISIQKRQFSAGRRNISMADRKLTRSQYLQIKSNQQLKQHNYWNPNLVDKLKIKTEERIKTQYMKDENQERSLGHFGSGKKYKLSLNRFYNEKKRDKSKVFTHSLQAKAQLLRQVKDKPILFQTIDDTSFKQQSLSNVDKYNLLYLKYKGNPPKITQEKLIIDLQSQSKMLRDGKPALLAFNKSISRENRLIIKRTS